MDEENRTEQGPVARPISSISKMMEDKNKRKSGANNKENVEEVVEETIKSGKKKRKREIKNKVIAGDGNDVQEREVDEVAESNTELSEMEDSRTVKEHKRHSRKTDKQWEERQMKYIDKRQQKLWENESQNSSISAIVKDGQIHYAGYGAFAKHVKKGGPLDQMLMSTLEMATQDNTLHDNPKKSVVGIGTTKSIPHNWKYLNVQKKKRIYKECILKNEARDLPGTNLSYDILREITKTWWPEDIVGPVRYATDLNGDDIDVIISAYLKAMSNSFLEETLRRCHGYVNGEELPEDISSVKDELKMHIEGHELVTAANDMIVDIVRPIGSRYPTMNGIGDVFKASSIALFGSSTMWPLTKIAAVVFQAGDRDDAQELLKIAGYPKTDDDVVNCFLAIAEYANCEVELQHSGGIHRLGFDGLLRLPKRMRNDTPQLSFSLLPNLRCVPHLPLDSDSENLCSEACGYNPFCRNKGDEDWMICQNCRYTYHNKCAQSGDQCGCANVGDCFRMMSEMFDIDDSFRGKLSEMAADHRFCEIIHQLLLDECCKEYLLLARATATQKQVLQEQIAKVMPEEQENESLLGKVMLLAVRLETKFDYLTISRAILLLNN